MKAASARQTSRGALQLELYHKSFRMVVRLLKAYEHGGSAASSSGIPGCGPSPWWDLLGGGCRLQIISKLHLCSCIPYLTSTRAFSTWSPSRQRL